MFPRIDTAPDVLTTIKESVREHRRHLASGSRYVSRYGTDRETVGRYQAVADAVVEAELHIEFGTRSGRASNWTEEHTVAFTAVARCTGHGCTDPTHQSAKGEVFLLDADADETAPNALPLIATARAWAQKHAETCRALPYTGR
ncbi:hypothetical protein [Streptomyces sp. 8L]|uniref:hypothetical protein n=1 Tax=Streptomyces sp. 8L TaxID=2877242 RepID=UPI001CD7573B|nr:hypothetical protein [Streptomyces sp. 8L]MCA1218484.1 hypothetical protein [Streptomyces sp. 8L]